MTKEILLISGKGGTGKTSFTAAFASLAKNLIICDLDVDAPNLHLLLNPKKIKHHEFWSGHSVFINDKCSNCGNCYEICNFDAIKKVNDQYLIDPFKCEGCKLCLELCSFKAIDFKPKQSGAWYISETRFGKFIHANLFPSEENSGRLVSLLKKEAKKLSKKEIY